MRLIVLTYPTYTENSELIEEVQLRAETFADVVVIGEHNKPQDNWKQMEGETTSPRRGDYIFVLEDTDYIDDISSIHRWLGLNSDAAYACMRLNMYKDNLYRMDGRYKPKLKYQLFPYIPNATLHDGLPTYSYALPYIQEPHLTILSFRNYGKENTNTAITTKKWENPIPQTASA